ncbi:MAG: 4-alpha-glucanotransferase, partial [Actinomycetota bacterium]|nr:4-alpha-glucanotransferase [Actinomycetota bacterium]
VSTHDLPTIAGAWTGEDAQAAEFAPKVAALTGLDADVAPATVAVAAHERLAASPCRLVVATLEDATGETDRPNQPGTTEPSNWSNGLPFPIDELAGSGLAAAVLDAVTSSDRRQ